MVNFYTRFKKDESVFASIPGAVSEIAYALGYIGGAKAQSAVERIVTDANPNLRIAGAESLVEMGAKSSVRTLSKIASGAGDLKSVIDAVAMLEVNLTERFHRTGRQRRAQDQCRSWP